MEIGSKVRLRWVKEKGGGVLSHFPELYRTQPFGLLLISFLPNVIGQFIAQSRFENFAPKSYISVHCVVFVGL